MEAPIVPTTPRTSRYLWLLLAVVALAHVPSMFSPFFLDDYVYLDQVSDLTWPKALGLFTSATLDRTASGVWWTPLGALPFYRPAGQLAFAWDRWVWGLWPVGYHLTNTALHMACVVLVWRLALRILGQGTWAGVAAAVFALHPIHVEAVTWLSGRFDLLVGFCALSSIASYLHWREFQAGGRGWAALTVLWFGAALACKETALVIPAVLACVELLGRPGSARRAGPLASMAAALAAVALIYVAVRLALFGGLFGRLPPPYGLDTTSPATALQEVAINFAQYVFGMLFLLPVEPGHFPQFWRAHPIILSAAAVVAGLLLAGMAVLGRSRATAVGAAWLVVFTGPSLLSMPGERNVYLASVGLALMISAAMRGWHQRFASTGPSRVEAGPAPIRRLKRIGCGILGFWIAICVVKQVLMGVLAASCAKTYRDLQALLPDPPANARIYFVHQNPLNSVGFTQGLRLHYGRSDLSGCALSLAPSLHASPVDRLVALGPDVVRLVRPEGAFFTSFFDRFHRFSEPAAGLAESARRSGLELLDPTTTYDGLNTLTFRLPEALDSPRVLFFHWDNGQVNRRLSILRLGSLTQVRPYTPESP